ncbi:FtsX-like permease family protein [Helicobacter saguini]|uniref:ABC transporter permease n=1 Tax=Helicobacter saguini TaxID=1548018 RepID=A0A347VQ55_9HELI|nr:ABC transporter permease [Helicobacter saguini]MWV61070.1 FtsX-like permease family protein [Helicobacter saguini]MWV68261.1 FtsX-like permease family protein [Helicobacter saguini]MWV70275.1 FtsX-like permease family protein [Helicobacter saguini]MWV72177.1 FtsX-like permease family protein [Helicobacter saguini]TLD95236.1 ABC transporter permease [Helicobacter saguini]
MLISFILKHYLKFDKTQPFISITAILAFLGVGVGVLVLLVTMSIMNGMIKEFESKLFIMNYPLTIFSTSFRGLDSNILNFLEKKFPNLKFSPYIQSQAIVRMNAEIYPVVAYGVDLERERAVNSVLDSMKMINVDSNNLNTSQNLTTNKNIESNHKDSKNPFIAVMGENLYHTLSLESDEKVTLIFTELAPTGIAMTPRMKKFEVAATYTSGLKNYDNSIIYTTFDALKAIKSQQNSRFDGIHIYSDDAFGDISKLKEALLEYERETQERLFADVQGWWEQNGNFFSAMELEKKALFFVLMLIILMASLNIISSLLMVVMNRRKEIALLISLGASKKQVKRIFFRLGAVIGGSGVIFGVVGALVVIWALKTFDIISIPADVYGTSSLPVDLLFSDLIYTIIGACAIVALSSYYPAKKASQIDVLSVLRNE